MAEEEKKEKELIQNSRICFLGTNHNDGYPRMKAMLNTKHEGIEKIWVLTNTGSKRVAQLRDDTKASIYFMDETRFMAYSWLVISPYGSIGKLGK